MVSSVEELHRRKLDIAAVTLLNQRGLAGHALPGVLFSNPGVGETPVAREGFPSLEAFVAIDTVDDGSVPINVNGHALIVDLLMLHFVICGAGEICLLVHERAVVIDINESVGE